MIDKKTFVKLPLAYANPVMVIDEGNGCFIAITDVLADDGSVSKEDQEKGIQPSVVFRKFVQCHEGIFVVVLCKCDRA